MLNHKIYDKVITARMPVAYQKCDQEGRQRGCLFKHDSPDEQCGDDRKGTVNLKFAWQRCTHNHSKNEIS